MAFTQYGYKYISFLKPPIGSFVDWSNPLSNKMSFLFLGNQKVDFPIEIITRKTSTSTTGFTGFVSPEKYGLSFLTSPSGGNSNHVLFGTYPAWDLQMNNGYYSVRIIISRMANGGNFDRIFHKDMTGGAASGSDWFFLLNTGSSNQVFWGHNTSVETDVQELNANVIGTWNDYIATYDGSNLNLYKNGGLEVSKSMTSPVNNHVKNVMFGASSNLSDGAPCKIALAQIWNRGLTAGEVRQLFVNPYGFMAFPSSRRYFFFGTPGAAVGATDTDSFGSWG